MSVPGRFRKKPVVIEAAQWAGVPAEHGKGPWVNPNIMGWLAFHKVEYELKANGELLLPTLEGVMTVSNGDWIIRGVHGEFYPCKPEIFEATYEKIEANNER